MSLKNNNGALYLKSNCYNCFYSVSAIALCTVAFLIIIAIMVACILVRLRKREKQQEKELAKKQQDIEMKQPLDDMHVQEAISENRQNQNYLARLDEFSMVSATLGGEIFIMLVQEAFQHVRGQIHFVSASLPT